MLSGIVSEIKYARLQVELVEVVGRGINVLVAKPRVGSAVRSSVGMANVAVAVGASVGMGVLVAGGGAIWVVRASTVALAIVLIWSGLICVGVADCRLHALRTTLNINITAVAIIFLFILISLLSRKSPCFRLLCNFTTFFEYYQHRKARVLSICALNGISYPVKCLFIREINNKLHPVLMVSVIKSPRLRYRH